MKELCRWLGGREGSGRRSPQRVQGIVASEMLATICDAVVVTGHGQQPPERFALDEFVNLT
jgi:hypothetical protein